MSTTPITLDFSKAQPISSPGSGVQLDFSKAQPIAAGGESGASQATGLRPQNTDERIQSMMGPNAPSGFMQHGDQAAGVAASVEGGNALIPKGLSTINSALKYLGIGSKAAEAVAPEAKQVATGLFDQYGDPIMKTLEPEAKQAVNKIISHPEVQEAIRKVAMNAVYSVVGGIGGHYGLKAIEHLMPSEK